MKNILQGIVGILLYIGFAELIKSYFGLPDWWTWIILVIIFAVIAFYYLLVYLSEEYDRSRCDHGVKNGKTKFKCLICKDEHEHSLLNIQKNKDMEIHEIMLSQIKKSAEVLQSAEANRINNDSFNKVVDLLLLSPQEFEDAIAKLYSKLGYVVTQTPYSNDGGKDAIAMKDGKKYLIECKRYALDKNIGRPMLQKFYAAMIEEKAVKGFFVTTSGFTDTSYEYIKGKNIELVDNKSLAGLIDIAFPQSIESQYFQQMCLVCGDIVQFKLIGGNEKEICKNNHNVNKHIPVIRKTITHIRRNTTKKKKYYR